ncbi:uncharacterized protein [Rutidosis leptorrhynchoides]|uniref:uncharacterized protein n=1 Tax=Rutidosis leptorrhynchoides TaxID=125765 RepID=UPI003A99FEF2
MLALYPDKSDHCPIILKDDDRNFGPKPIKIFEEWLDIDGIDQVIKEVWVEEVGGDSRLDCHLRNKLKSTKLALKSKSIVKFGNLEGEIEMFKSITNTLELKAELGCINDEEREQWLEARKEWIQRDRIKVNMLKQKARIRWILEGDENIRKQPTTISRVVLRNTTSRPCLVDLSYPNLSIDEARGLEAPISEEEIVEAIHDCGCTKAPGLYGFNLRFFKKFWE